MESAQLNAIASLATLFVTPSLRNQSVSHAPRSPRLSLGFGFGLYEGSGVLRSGVADTEMHRTVATAQFGGGIDARTNLKLLLPIGFRGDCGDFYTSEDAVSAFQPCVLNSIIPSSSEDWEDWLSTFDRLRRGRPLVNMEDRVLDRFADHQS